MENAVNALKMAAAVLIFIIAIGTSFSVFSTAKQTADAIIGMRDKQAYLEAAEDVDGILYTSSESISSGSVSGVTPNGDRVVKIDDVFSTIYRYAKEKYGVTIVKSDGTVIARFDSNTESVMAKYNNIESGFDDYKDKIEENTKSSYASPNFDNLEELYKLTTEVDGAPGGYGAPWYGNDEEIQRRINCDINGGTYTYNGKTYQGKRLLEALQSARKIIEVTNEIDQSHYLEENDDEGNPIDTNLLQQYEMPTVEIIYIVY